MPVESTSKRRCARRSGPTVSSPSPEGRGGQGVRTRLLDKVVRYRFGDNAELMGAWESARNVAGSFQTKNEPDSGVSGSETPKAA